MSLYPDMAAEHPGIKLEEQKEMQEFDADSEKNENEEAADLERNCNLDEPPTVNNNDDQRQSLQDEENLQEQVIVEVNKEPLEIFRKDEIVEVDNDIENFETGDGDMKNDSDKDTDIEAEDQEIAGVQIPNENDEEEDLGRGKRKRLKYPCYFNADSVNTIMVEGDS